MYDARVPATERDEVGGRYAWYVLVVLVIVYVFNFIDRQILSILAEEIKADIGLSDSEIGFLYGTVFAVFYAIFGIPLGRLADVWVRKSLIAIGLAFWSAMTALSGTARSFPVLGAYRIGVGVGEASASPAAYLVARRLVSRAAAGDSALDLLERRLHRRGHRDLPRRLDRRRVARGVPRRHRAARSARLARRVFRGRPARASARALGREPARAAPRAERGPARAAAQPAPASASSGSS